ncbi:unnamed protein product [Adineta steineri]|uniref:Uncharacterized protein n=1 Tax=Adineta steineri TaxID=433720 RepID=A0A819E2D2_9BILA|nr:unnamed protein product [Adineta steineri]CAF1344521.1 unnamed protein product [Adineta steineri]CAF3560114.1 unnamed protein product [Adineta steineri]CAF3843213.1 unnamed protein product [Adineta steineri]
MKKPKKRHDYKLFNRKSLLICFHSKHRLKSDLYALEEKFPKKKSRSRGIIKNIYQTYQSLSSIVILIFQIFSYIDKITREIFLFIEKLVQIIRVIYGWIQMIRSILSAIHLITTRIIILSSHVHRIFILLSILFQPFANGNFQNSVRSFSHFIFYYYSSNGACYTLQARTRHIVRKVRQRWKNKHNGINDDDDIYYDAYSDEWDWL